MQTQLETTVEQQIPTYINDILKDLEPKYQEMLMMRIQGQPYSKVAEHFDYEEQSVRALFSKEGKLRPLWDWYKEVFHKEATIETLRILKSNAPNVARALVNRATKGGFYDVAAATKVLEYSLGKPLERVEHGGVVGVANLTDLIKEKYGKGYSGVDTTGMEEQPEGIS